MLDYFYGAQAEQFAFYRVPKVLFTNDRFKYLSAEAKTLYGILLDRVPLSAKNGWIDEQGRVYIICTIEEIMDDMNCGNKKAIQLLSDLEEKVGLIERKRQGLGKPNLIYVKNFISVDSPVERHFLKCQNDTSGSVEITSLEVSKGHGNKTDSINTEYSDTDSFYSGRSVGKGSEAMRIRTQYEEYFRESIELDYLSRDRTLDQDALHAMVDLMVDVCCSIRISKKKHLKFNTVCVNEQGQTEFQSAVMDITQRYQEREKQEAGRYLKALSEVYDKIFEFNLEDHTVKCLYGQNSPSFKWLENIPMQMESAMDQWISGAAAEEDRENLRSFFRDFYHGKLQQEDGRPPRIVYRARSSNGCFKTYTGIFLKLKGEVSLYCCRCAPEEQENDTLRRENRRPLKTTF